MNKQLKIESAKQLSFLSEISLPSYPLTLLSSFKRSAFTLAETLIVLAVIGVVAALTLPTFIQNYKKKVTVTQLKQTYSILSQALETSKNENGEISTWDFSLDNVDFANKYVLPYLKVAQIENSVNSTNYWAVKALMPGAYAYLTWPSSKNKLTTNPIYMLPNGSAFSVARFLDFRTEAVIDINGPKGPNTLGVDGFVFVFNSAKNLLLPRGYGLKRDAMLGKNSQDSYACSRDINTGNYYQGSYCAAVIMLDGWEIKEDYPWGNGGKPKRKQ